jgi:hypothetical protein
MKRILCIAGILASAGVAFAGEMENAVVSSDLSRVSFQEMKLLDIPAPVVEEVKSPASSNWIENWIETVKDAYERFAFSANVDQEYTKPELSELPVSAGKQLASYKETAPSFAYKMVVQGKTVFIIQQYREGGATSATLYDEQGAFLASGGLSDGESDMVKWDNKTSAEAKHTEKARMADVSIPAYGMTCTAQDGSMVRIVPFSGLVTVEVVNRFGKTIADNNFRTVTIPSSVGTKYLFSDWLEMGQKAVLELTSDESMKGASFEFQFDAQQELGVPSKFSNCDIM